MGIKGLVWAFIGLGMLMGFLYLWTPLAGIYDVLGDTETWGGATANVTAAMSPTSEVFGGSWKYIILVVGVGGILYLIFTALKGGGRSDE